MRTDILEKLTPGARVMFARTFLRNTGQYVGDDAPCHSGPFARGELLTLDAETLSMTLAEIKWDDGKTSKVNVCNIWPCDVAESV